MHLKKVYVADGLFEKIERELGLSSYVSHPNEIADLIHDDEHNT